jgi:hypothetical protein
MQRFKIEVDSGEPIEITIASDSVDESGSVTYPDDSWILKQFISDRGGMFGPIDPEDCSARDLLHALTTTHTPLSPFGLEVAIVSAPEMPELEPLPEGAIV